MKHKAHILAAVCAIALFAGSMASPMHVVPAIGQSGLQSAWEAGQRNPEDDSRMAWASMRAHAESIREPGVAGQSSARSTAPKSPHKLAQIQIVKPSAPSPIIPLPDWDIQDELATNTALLHVEFEALVDPQVASANDALMAFLSPMPTTGGFMPDGFDFGPPPPPPFGHPGPGFGPPLPGPMWFAEAGPMFGPPPPPAPFGHPGPGFGPPPPPPMF